MSRRSDWLLAAIAALLCAAAGALFIASRSTREEARAAEYHRLTGELPAAELAAEHIPADLRTAAGQ